MSVESSLSDTTKLREFASICDVMVIDAEIGSDVVHELEALCRHVYPRHATLGVLQDRLLQQSFFYANGFSVAETEEISDIDSAVRAGKSLSYPFILKTRCRDNGFSITVSSENDICSILKRAGAADVFAQRSIPFVKSLIVTVVLSHGGEQLFYPISEDLGELIICPAEVPAKLEAAVKRLAAQVVDALQDDKLPGLFAIKIFVLENDDLHLHGVSPLPHRAASASIDACGVSHYDALLRILLGYPMHVNLEALNNRSSIFSAVFSLNRNGNSDELAKLSNALQVSGCHSYWYGASDGAAGQPVGHVTILAENIPDLLNKANLIGVDTDNIAGTIVKRFARVSIVVNSREELAFIGGAISIFDKFKVTYDVSIASAHLTPSRVYSLSESAVDKGYAVIIATSRGEPHLANMINSLTCLPVIAQIIPETSSSSTALVVRVGAPIAHVVSNDGSDAAALAVRILGSSDLRGSEPMRDKIQQMNNEKEAAMLQDALRLDSIGLEQFMNDISSKY